MLYQNAAPGIHRVEHAYTNFYTVEDEGCLSIIDTGLPESWDLLYEALSELSFKASDISAIAITHGHFDHLGFAKRAQDELGVPIWIHSRDAHIARQPYHCDHENSRLPYPLKNPKAIPMNVSLIKEGALQVEGVEDVLLFNDTTEVLDIPGSPEVILLPGHTDGQCAFFFPEKFGLITGEALVTLDIYTGDKGPQIISGAATANSEQALESLERLIPTGASVILPGHGEPWDRGVASAVEEAKRKGAS